MAKVNCNAQSSLQAATTIAIVGGGLVGMSLALLLRHYLPRAHITLVERQSHVDSANAQPLDTRATALSAGSQAILEQVGCWPTLRAHAQPIAHIQVSDRGHYGGLNLSADHHGIPAFGYVVENHHLLRVLYQQLNLVHQSHLRMLVPAEVSHCEPQPQGYGLTLKREGEQQQLHTDLLIIADGVESHLQQSLGISTEVKHFGQDAMITTVQLDRPHRNCAYERFTSKGPIALLPLPDVGTAAQPIHRAALVWTFSSEEQTGLAQLNELDLLQRFHTWFGYRAGLVRSLGNRHYYPLRRVRTTESIRPHLVVMGNAAHLLHPVAGQGFNLSLRDGLALAETLSQSQSQCIGTFCDLQAYQQRQWHDQQRTIAITDNLASGFASNRADVAITRQLSLLGLSGHTTMQQKFVQQMMGLLSV